MNGSKRKWRSKMVRINFLNEEELDQIHQTSLKILGQTGIAVKNLSALDLLRQNGCNVEAGIATIPSKLVE
ncbi:MAG: trimethylamine methyltransferase family protein, partial [Promethearchaeota archaeon]